MGEALCQRIEHKIYTGMNQYKSRRHPDPDLLGEGSHNKLLSQNKIFIYDIILFSLVGL